jgi:DNA polymerase
MAGPSPQQAAAARARLALRAERAWGITLLPDFQMPQTPLAPVAPPASPPSGAGDAPAGGLFAQGLSLATESPASVAPAFTDPPHPRGRRVELLRQLDDQEVKNCTLCTLCRDRTTTVFGEGDPEARLMFIGEGPGETEDLTGRPFVGKAGRKLDEMIMAMGLAREEVYIANVVKCRPPNNRVPTAMEVDTCTPYLHRQIELIRPRVIVTLGLPATRHLLKTVLPMGKLRGKWSQWRGIRVMPTYHPAYLLRSYTAENRRVVWEDLQQVMNELGLSRPASHRA